MWTCLLGQEVVLQTHMCRTKFWVRYSCHVLEAVHFPSRCTLQETLRHWNEMCIFGSLCCYSRRLQSVGLGNILLVLSRVESLSEASSNSFWAGGLMQPWEDDPFRSKNRLSEATSCHSETDIAIHQKTAPYVLHLEALGVSIMSLVSAYVFCFIIWQHIFSLTVSPQGSVKMHWQVGQAWSSNRDWNRINKFLQDVYLPNGSLPMWTNTVLSVPLSQYLSWLAGAYIIAVGQSFVHPTWVQSYPLKLSWWDVSGYYELSSKITWKDSKCDPSESLTPTKFKL